MVDKRSYGVIMELHLTTSWVSDDCLIYIGNYEWPREIAPEANVQAKLMLAESLNGSAVCGK